MVCKRECMPPCSSYYIFEGSRVQNSGDHVYWALVDVEPCIIGYHLEWRVSIQMLFWDKIVINAPLNEQIYGITNICFGTSAIHIGKLYFIHELMKSLGKFLYSELQTRLQRTCSLKRRLSSGKRWKIICQRYHFYYASVEEHQIRHVPWKAWLFKCLHILNMSCNIVKIRVGFLPHVFM